MAIALRGSCALAKASALCKFSFSFLRNWSASTLAGNAAAAAAESAGAASKKSKRRKKKNFFEVAQFLPNWGIGHHMANAHWTSVSYEITKINLYKFLDVSQDGRHGKAWGIAHKDAELVCEELPIGECSFSVASSGYRCLLETFESADGAVAYQCKTSQVMANRMDAYMESDECVSACGVDKSSVGISSDALLETRFITQLCSPQCYQNCPNVVYLYYTLALAEGVFLPDLCKAQRLNRRRSMFQLLSSGAAASASASAPISSASAPSPSSVDCAPPPM